jgi:hypothetical protein
MVSGIESMIISLREAGYMLVLLWLLTLSIVYGLLSHAKLPKSMSARGVISIASAFLVLLAAAASPTVTFVSNLITASIVIAFALIVAIIFLEIAEIRVGEKTIFKEHPKFFATVILVLAIMIFIGAGGLAVVGFPSFAISDSMIAIFFFLVVMVVAIWVMMKETGEKKKE